MSTGLQHSQGVSVKRLTGCRMGEREGTGDGASEMRCWLSAKHDVTA